MMYYYRDETIIKADINPTYKQMHSPLMRATLFFFYFALSVPQNKPLLSFSEVIYQRSYVLTVLIDNEDMP